jgi:hypothetical protein
MRNQPSDLVLRGPEDLSQLGAYVRAQRYRVGLSLANDAAPYLGVGVRLLTELESGTRGTRGVTLRKLLGVLQGLGLELVVRPRPLIIGNATSTGVGTSQATGHVTPPSDGAIRTPGKRRTKQEKNNKTKNAVRRGGRRAPRTR